MVSDPGVKYERLHYNRLVNYNFNYPHLGKRKYRYSHLCKALIYR